MKSDHRIPNWLRPVWALLLLALFTTEYSSVSAAISATSSVDQNWIAIDRNFPETHNKEHPDKVDQFFYVRGLIDEKMHLTNKTIADIDGKGISRFRVKFQIWRNAIKCAKYVSVTPDYITNFDDGKWFLIDRFYTEQEFRNFQIWLSTNRECENSVMAIKDLTLSYNNYINITSPTIPEEKFKDFAVPKTENFPLSTDAKPANQYLLWDCDKEECSMEIKLTTTDDLTLTFWSLKEATISFVGSDQKETTSNAAIPVTLLKDADLKSTDLTIKIKSKEPTTSIVQIGEVIDPADTTVKDIYSEVLDKKIGNWLKVHSWGKAEAFLNAHKDKQLQILPQFTTSSSLKLVPETTGTVGDMAKACYKLFYYVDLAATQDKFTVSVDSHSNEFVQRYDLFDFIPIHGSEQSLEFCMADFIHDLTKVFTDKPQLYLKTEASKDKNIASPKMTLVYAEKLTKIQEVHTNPIHFIPGSYAKKWITIQPGLPAEIPITNDPIKIAAAPQTQTKQISSVWLVNDPNLYRAPVELTLKLNRKFETLSADFEFKTQICDDTMLCVDMQEEIKQRKITTDETAGSSSVVYTFDLDAGKESDRPVKLRIDVKLPQGVSAEINLINFGDSCHRSEDKKCPANSECKVQDPAINPANDFEKTCTCLAGHKGTDCKIVDHCASPTVCPAAPATTGKCTNNADDSGHECVCDSSAKLQFWDGTKCGLVGVAFKEETAKKKYSWIADLSKVNPKVYDVCYKFKTTSIDSSAGKPAVPVTVTVLFENKPPEDKNEQTISWSDTYKIAAAVNNKEYIHFCLSKLFDTYIQTGAKLTILAEPTEGGAVAEHEFKEADIQITALPVDHTIKPESKHPIFTANAFVGDAHANVQPADVNNLQIINLVEELPEKGQIRLYSDWLPNHADQLNDNDKINKNLLSFVETAKSQTFLKPSMKICRPQTVGQFDCVDYQNNLADVLKTLQVNEKYQKFQVVLTIEAIKAVKPTDLATADRLSLHTSVWDGCIVQGAACANGAKCYSTNLLSYKCGTSPTDLKCPTGFAGINCEIVYGDSCNADNKATCAKQHGTCVALKDKDFQCECASGYVYDKPSKTCEKVGVEHIVKECLPGTNECFIDKLLIDPFTHLPTNFPLIETTTNRKLYYTVHSDSKLTIDVDDKEKLLSHPENDICVHIKYFVGQNYKLALRFNEQIKLLTIDDVIAIDSKVTSAIPLSESTVCIKALLPYGKFDGLEKFKLEFITQTATPNGAVVIELVPLDLTNLLHFRNNLVLPDIPLKYISRETKEQINATEAITTKNSLVYQWPAFFPDKQWKQTDKAFQFEGHKRDTIETVYLESAWINRPMGSLFANQLPVYLNFKVDLPVEYKDKDHFKMNIVLLDEERATIQSVNEITGDVVKETPRSDRKSKEFIIRLDQSMELSKVYKVQFQIRYQDMKAVTANVLFTISDISFGDPCIAQKKNVIDPTILFMGPRECFTAQNHQIKADPNSHCQRTVNVTSGLIDFMCNCPKDSGLSGKDCSNADYCVFKHEISVTDPDHPINIVKTINSGNEFCNQDVKNPKSTCKKGRFDSYNFLCVCANPETHFDFFKKECVPISPCILNPCNFDTETCKVNETANEFKRVCDCKHGFERKDNGCQSIHLENQECDVVKYCGTADPNMKCLAGINGHTTCKCPKGFKFTLEPGSDPKCKPDMCHFKGLHSCQQGCEPSNNGPNYFTCTCGDNYDGPFERKDVSSNATIYECTLKSNAPAACKDWSGKYKTCVSGKKGCIDGFMYNATTDNCVPQATYKMPACPGIYKFDDVTHEYVCDCKNTTRSYFTEDSVIKSTCSLTQSICDSGEPGRNVCSQRNAGCLVNLDNIDDYSCECHIGKMFPDTKRVKSAKDVLAKPTTSCLDVCDLPYRQSACASMGGKCNSMKLWMKVSPTNPNAVIEPKDYCDCVPGTFYNGNGYCVQERDSLMFDITFRWSHTLQDNFDEIKKALLTMHDTAAFADQTAGSRLAYIDPIGLARAELRAMELNSNEEQNSEQQWGKLIRERLLYEQAERMLHNFKMIDELLKGPTDKQDLQILAVNESKIDGFTNYVIRLAAKIPQTILNQANQQYRLQMSEPMVLETAADAATTVAPTTVAVATKAPVDNNLPDSVQILYNEIKANCHEMKNKLNCIIPYMSLVLGGTAEVVPALHKPCTNIETCQGMSNCNEQTRSQFSCECDTKYFELESRSTFKTVDQMMVFKNERCIAKKPCDTECIPSDLNRHCINRAPERNAATHDWTVSHECGCKAKYALQGNTTGTAKCTDVCVIQGCSSHSKCQAETSSATCQCNNGYYGTKCEHELSSNTWWIVGIVVLGVLALAAIGAAVFFWRSSSNTPSRSSSSTPLSPINGNRQANIRRISAGKPSLENLEPKTESKFTSDYDAIESPENLPEFNHQNPQLIVSTNSSPYEVRQVESANQQAASSGLLEPGQPRLYHTRIEQIAAEEKLSQHSMSSVSQKSGKSAEDSISISGLKYGFNTARSSFISADVQSFDFSRQTSVNSLTIHEPFTPFNASPKTLYSRKSIATIAPTIEETNEVMYGQINDELRHSQRSQYSHSSSSSSETSSIPPSDGHLPTIAQEHEPESSDSFEGPPEPSRLGEARFVEPNSESTSRKSSSSESEHQQVQIKVQESADPPEPGNLTLTQPKSSSPETQKFQSTNLLVDSQEMNQDKFQSVRAKIASVLKLNSFRSYELSRPNSPEVPRK